MSGKSSTGLDNSQPGLFNPVEFCRRLRAERRAKGLNQRDFGKLAGVGLQTQSRYENGETQPNAEYLANLSDQGVDVLYVLTGNRIESALDKETADLVDDFGQLPAHLRQMARSVIRTMRDEASNPSPGAGSYPPVSATVHEKKSPSATTSR